MADKPKTKSKVTVTPLPKAEPIESIQLQKSSCIVTVPVGPIADSWKEAGFEPLEK